MPDMLRIVITGELPEASKYATLAAAEEATKDLISRFASLKLTAKVSAVKPQAKKP